MPIPASILGLPKAVLKARTDQYLQERGLNLIGLGEESSSNESETECQDPVTCTHQVKRIPYVPKTNWREKIRLYKDHEQRSKSLAQLPPVRPMGEITRSKFKPQIFSLQNYYRILEEQ